jgi:hypothetical protein
MNQNLWKTIAIWIGKIAVTAAMLLISLYVGLYLYMFLPMTGLHFVLIIIACLLFPALIPMLFVQRPFRYLIGYGITLAVFIVACIGNLIYHD